jgi:hypothetical protein
VNWVPVKSRMLAAVAYNHQWRQRYLRFRSGEICCYTGVPDQVYEELLGAESKGRYVRMHVLHHYPYQRIHAAVLTAS